MANTNISIQLVLLLFLSSGFLYLETVKFCSCNDSCKENEGKALLKFKTGLKDPSGRLAAWVGNHCCSWPGVVCSNRNRHVIKLKLGNQYSSNSEDGAAYALGGEISSSLLDLKYLNYLDLSMNNFGEIPIPDFIGSLKKLRYLNLSGSSFGGTIPPNLGNLSSLQYLDLSSNFIRSNNENSLIFLSNPHINLTSLLVLDLSNNDFNSTVPPYLFNLTSLVYLDLSSNNFQGEIDEFSRLNFLEHLDLSANSFISGKLSRRIRGEINDFINSLAECTNLSLESIHLGYNKLDGFLPNSLGYLRSLKLVMLMGNSFSGSIPESIGNLSSLKEFYLFDNQMKGSIPVSLGKLSSLVVLDISGNQWEGIITEAHFSNLTSLKELTIIQSIKNFTLVFNVSANWIPPFKLTYVNLQACLVGPKFPLWLRNQNMLTYIVMSFGKISGTIPNWFLKLDLFLDVLDFSYNQLTGNVPNTIRFRDEGWVFFNHNNFTGSLPLFSSNLVSYHLENNFLSGPIPLDFGEMMPMLRDIDISDNSVSGIIPFSTAKLANLWFFSASNNKLTGKIPEIWNYTPLVCVIDVSNNSLSGNIPISLSSLIGLRFLRLSNNKLSGELPSALQNCTFMEALDLGDNSFSGKIPEWLGEKIPSLLIISLRSNLFVGEIPSNLCNLSSLHILDLAENMLSGEIPSCIGKLSGMTTFLEDMRYEGQLWVVAKNREYLYDGTLYLVNSIDLSGNNLSGEMPKGLTNLSRLGTLNLSMNHLIGIIPAEIGNLQRLETLDLSRNNLSGKIPSSMASITSLNHLNLSYNNLSGQIPTTNQFETFNDPSIYQGNPALCGLPLPTKCNGGKVETYEPPPEEEDTDENEMFWFYMGIGPGFAVGFWVVCGTLIVKKSWRHAYFQFIDDMKNRIIVVFLVKLAHLRRFLKRKDT